MATLSIRTIELVCQHGASTREVADCRLRGSWVYIGANDRWECFLVVGDPLTKVAVTGNGNAMLCPEAHEPLHPGAAPKKRRHAPMFDLQALRDFLSSVADFCRSNIGA